MYLHNFLIHRNSNSSRFAQYDSIQKLVIYFYFIQCIIYNYILLASLVNKICSAQFSGNIVFI